MIQKTKWLFPLLFVAMILAACGDSDEVTNPPQNNDDETQQQDPNNDDSNSGTSNNVDDGDTKTNDNNDDTNNDPDTTSTNATYSFTSFNLEADFNDTRDTLDADYDQEPNETEASYEDKSQNINLQGDKAMEELDKIFSNFDFDENTADDEVLKTVTEAFNVPEDAQNVELEIEFPNGTEKEYRR